MKLVLRYPTLNDIAAIKAANEEAWESHFPFLHYFETLAQSSYEQYVELVPRFISRKILPTGHVPNTFLFAFDYTHKVVGRVSIRHELNEQLARVGGHIGYGVVPSERKKGYASEMLWLSLDYVRQHLPDLSAVLLTCDDDNLASIRTIEKNGGRLLNKIQDTGMLVPKRRYEIQL